VDEDDDDHGAQVVVEEVLVDGVFSQCCVVEAVEEGVHSQGARVVVVVEEVLWVGVFSQWW